MREFVAGASSACTGARGAQACCIAWGWSFHPPYDDLKGAERLSSSGDCGEPAEGSVSASQGGWARYSVFRHGLANFDLSLAV